MFLDKESSEEFVWHKMDKMFFKLKHDIFICTVYIPPQNSSRESRLNIDHFEKLQNNIYKFANKGSIILCGDFNARMETEKTGTPCEIPPSKWFEHFKNLNRINLDNKRTSNEAQLVKDFNIWAVESNEILDRPISLEEVCLLSNYE